MKRQILKRQVKSRRPRLQLNRFALAPNIYTAQSIRQITIRTVAQSAQTGFEIQNFQLANLLGIVASSATTSFNITAVFRLRKIRMWGPVATAGVPVTVALTWENSSQDFMTPPKTMSDTSISFDRPAHLNETPPTESLAAKWHGSASTNVAVFMNYPANCIIDFLFDWVLNDDSSNYAPIAGPVLTGATAGTFYHHPIAPLNPINVNLL